MLYALAALLAFQFLGEVLVRALHLPLPGALAGMLLLFGALVLRGSVPAPLASTSRQLLQHLMLLFVPAVAGVMLHFDRVAREWQPFLIASVVSTLVTLAVTALTLQWLLRRQPPPGTGMDRGTGMDTTTAMETGTGAAPQPPAQTAVQAEPGAGAGTDTGTGTGREHQP